MLFFIKLSNSIIFFWISFILSSIIDKFTPEFICFSGNLFEFEFKFALILIFENSSSNNFIFSSIIELIFGLFSIISLILFSKELSFLFNLLIVLFNVFFNFSKSSFIN